MNRLFQSRHPRLFHVSAFLAACALVCACTPKQSTDRRIPLDPQTLSSMDHEDRHAIRKLAWSAINHAVEDRCGLPMWRTWTRKNEWYPSGSPAEGSRELSNFRSPVQLLPGIISILGMHIPIVTMTPSAVTCVDAKSAGSGSPTKRDPRPRPSSMLQRSILVDVRVNGLASAHIAKHELTKSRVLTQMLADGGTGPRGCEIPQFETGGAAIKAIWWPLRKTDPTGKMPNFSCVPVWDGYRVAPIKAGANGTQRSRAGNDLFRWNRRVAVDTRDCEANLPAYANVTHADWRWTESRAITEPMPVVPLRQFHWIRFEKAEDLTPQVTSCFREIYGEEPRVGDYLILVGFHISVKEHADWLWITSWWHDRADTGAFAEDRPGNLPAPWNNYLMDATYMQDTPALTRRGERPIYNPYLEAAQCNGLISNCVSCHQRAAWSPKPDPILDQSMTKVQPGVICDDDPYFKDRLRLDYVWMLRNAK